MAEAVYTDRGRVVETQSSRSQSDAFNNVRVSQFEPMAGWTFAYNINAALVISSTDGVTGTVTHDGNEAVLSTGTAVDGFAQIQTIKATRYVPGIGGLCRFTARFHTPKADSTQLVGLIDDDDGWAFGYNGLTFGILRRSGGVDTWTAQANWSEDTRGSLDPTKGNVYQIEYQWLGYGAQTFSIERTNGEIGTVHVIEYANTEVDTSVSNPNLPITARVENAGNATDMILYTPSAVAGVEGDQYNDAVSTVISADFIGSIASGLAQPVIAIRNPATWLTKNNHMFFQILRLSFAADGSKPILFKLYKAPTITGGAFADIAPNTSPIQVNTTFTSISGGYPIGSYAIAKDGNTTIDLNASRVKAFEGEDIVVMADTTSTSDIVAAVTMRQYL